MQCEKEKFNLDRERLRFSTLKNAKMKKQMMKLFIMNVASKTILTESSNSLTQFRATS